MLVRTTETTHSKPAVLAALAIVVAAAATILGAFFFQYGLGYPPCPLCLDQRIAYYVAIPLAALIALSAWHEAPQSILLAGFGVIFATMLINAGLGIYHAGIEWHFWPGPTDCSGPATLPKSGNLLDRLNDVRVVRCDEAAWRLLGQCLEANRFQIARHTRSQAGWR